MSNLRIPARDGRYFDPVRRHYFRTENLFVVAPECGEPISNQVLPKEGRYFDSWDRHYYKIAHLFGIDDKCQCGVHGCGRHRHRHRYGFDSDFDFDFNSDFDSDLRDRIPHNRPFLIDANRVCCSDPNKCDDIFYNARDCFYYKIRAR